MWNAVTARYRKSSKSRNPEALPDRDRAAFDEVDFDEVDFIVDSLGDAAGRAATKVIGDLVNPVC